MYLIDTSVWIDFFRQNKTPPVNQFYRILENNEEYGITEFIYQEVIQGALSETDFSHLENYLVSQTFFYPKHRIESYKEAARIYFSCRRTKELPFAAQ